MDESAKIEPGKLFVGGLAWETTKESMQTYFEKFGEVSDCVVMIDQSTNKPRGFGFVTFVNSSSVSKVFEVPKTSHFLDGKQIDPKLATLKGAGKSKYKLFIGGISPESSNQSIRAFVTKLFTENGVDCSIVDIDIKCNGDKPKGFGFMDVANKEGVDFIVGNGPHYMIDGKKVEFKRANPQDKKGMGHGQYHSDHGQVMFNQQGTGYYMDRSSQYPNGGGSYLYSGYPAGYSNYPPQPAAPQYNYAQYGGRGYTGQQQMGSYSNDATYNQASSTFGNSGDTSYTSTAGMYQGYGGQQTGYNYAGEQTSGSSPSYSRVGMTSQTRGGVGHGYQGYGSR